jgi:hypothetical protein
MSNFEWTDDVSERAVTERGFSLLSEGRTVPGVVWSPTDSPPRAIVGATAAGCTSGLSGCPDRPAQWFATRVSPRSPSTRSATATDWSTVIGKRPTASPSSKQQEPWTCARRSSLGTA